MAKKAPLVESVEPAEAVVDSRKTAVEPVEAAAVEPAAVEAAEEAFMEAVESAEPPMKAAAVESTEPAVKPAKAAAVETAAMESAETTAMEPTAVKASMLGPGLRAYQQSCSQGRCRGQTRQCVHGRTLLIDKRKAFFVVGPVTKILSPLRKVGMTFSVTRFCGQ